jgi:diguanylate cyclase (GGDEF)-like protein
VAPLGGTGATARARKRVAAREPSLSAEPSPIENINDAGVVRTASSALPSLRLVRKLREQDAKGEKSIALAQAAIAAFVAGVHVFGLHRGVLHFDGAVWVAIAALMASSAARWVLADRQPLPERGLDILSVVDVAIVLGLIWFSQYTFGVPASGVLRAPVFVVLLVLVATRALRFHPRPVIVVGIAAIAGWSLLVCGAVVSDGWDIITNDYHRYLSSFSILPAVEAVRILGLTALVIVLTAGAISARSILSRAAHVADYGEALDAARKHLKDSARARAQAEGALAALDLREAELSEQNRLFNAALSNMSQGLCMFGQDQKLLVCNARYVEMYGLSSDLAEPGTPFRKIVESRIEKGQFDGEDPAAYLDERLASVREAVRHTRLHELSDGRVIAISHEPMQGGGWVATHDDVTHLRRIEEKLSHLARHDALTDLPNRTQLRERMDEVLRGDALQRGFLIVLLFEIDRFNEINDTFGQSVGDALLQDLAHRLRRRTDGADMVARVGGDEFVVLQIAEAPAVAADALAKHVQDVLGPSFDIDDQAISISVSIGVAVAPVDGEDADKLLKNAHLALDRAKHDGLGNARFFEQGMDERVRARRQLEEDMRAALRHEQFELYYQPQVNLQSGEIVAFEALLRWNHPTRGMITPAEFVPVAEDTGFIVQLGDWALRRACEDAMSWPRGLRVAVNLSVAQFRSGHVRQSVISALGASTLSPNRLELEITESVLMDDTREVSDVLEALQEIGVAIALDDFGTGFSSLSYLTRLRFDKIKIDKHFIRALQDEPRSALAVLRSVVALSKSLGISTLAEGIETAEQLERVRAEGCTEAQGYHTGRPMAVADVTALLADDAHRDRSGSRAG